MAVTNEAVIMGAFGLVGVFITQLSQLVLAYMNHKAVMSGVKTVEVKADAAYQEANGSNEKLLLVHQKLNDIECAAKAEE